MNTTFQEEIFDALMWAQAVESLVRDCVLLCYEIKKNRLDGVVVFNPTDRQLKNIKKKMGLGALINELKVHITEDELCERILKFSESRNFLAHKAAVEYMNMLRVIVLKAEYEDKSVKYGNIKAEAGELSEKLWQLKAKLEQELKHVTSAFRGTQGSCAH
jgi:hypothetical protein